MIEGARQAQGSAENGVGPATRGANRSKSHLGTRPGGVFAAVQKSVVWAAPWRNGKECLSAIRIAWEWSQGQSRSAFT